MLGVANRGLGGASAATTTGELAARVQELERRRAELQARRERSAARLELKQQVASWDTRHIVTTPALTPQLCAVFRLVKSLRTFTSAVYADSSHRGKSVHVVPRRAMLEL